MSEDKLLLSISEVAAATGLRSSALRYYEKAGLVASTQRVGGRRHYPREVLQRLAVVALLQEVGFTIGEIARLVNERGRGSSWRVLAETKLGEIDAHLERVSSARSLLKSALECRCSNLEKCDLVRERSGPHHRVTQTLALGLGPPRQD